jgi:hypothetical protein
MKPVVKRYYRFAALFAGRTDAVGLDRGAVQKTAVGIRHYAGHLSGAPGLGIGIFPVRDDATVLFAGRTEL